MGLDIPVISERIYTTFTTLHCASIPTLWQQSEGRPQMHIWITYKDLNRNIGPTLYYVALSTMYLH